MGKFVAVGVYLQQHEHAANWLPGSKLYLNHVTLNLLLMQQVHQVPVEILAFVCKNPGMGGKT
jgi:hypothetical protein